MLVDTGLLRFMPYGVICAALICAISLGGAIGVGLYVVVPAIVAPAAVLTLVIVLKEKSLRKIMACVATLSFSALLLWPRYAYFRIGALPGVTPPRLMVSLLILCFIANWIKSAKSRSTFARSTHGIAAGVSLVVAFCGSRLLSVIVSADPAPSLFPLINELVFFGGGFLVALEVSREEGAPEALYRVLIAVTWGICAIAFAEYIKQKNIFMGVFPVTDEYALQAMQGKIRDSGYRVQGTFDNPLSLAQYLSTVMPMLVSRVIGRKLDVWGVLAMAAAGASTLAIVMTGSRSALIFTVLAVLLLYAFAIKDRFARKEVTLGGGVASVVALIVLFILAISAVSYIEGLLLGRSAAEASSTNARLIMLDRAWPLVLEKPLFGHGVSRAAQLIGFYGAGGVLTVDSLLISFAVESGLVGLLSYVGLILYALRSACTTPARGRCGYLFGAGLCSALGAFLVSSATLSLTGNLFFLAVLLAFAFNRSSNGEKL